MRVCYLTFYFNFTNNFVIIKILSVSMISTNKSLTLYIVSLLIKGLRTGGIVDDRREEAVV